MIDNENIKPVLDLNLIQEKANEYAMKGAMEAIKDYYSGYNSPYKKAIEDNLKNRRIEGIDIPDIIGIINESLSNEVDAIANTAIANTYIPLVKKLLTRAPAEIKFSEILKIYVDSEFDKYYGDEIYMDEFTCIAEKDDKYGWYSIEIQSPRKSYEFTLHEVYVSDKYKKELEEKGLVYIPKYTIGRLPSEKSEYTTGSYGSYKHNMTLKLDGASLELPFQKDILSDNFISLMASYLIAKTSIILDSTDFDDDMMPEKECHC